jgi:prepilin-type N-terminal cleavage/methylation domain-containing protein
MLPDISTRRDQDVIKQLKSRMASEEGFTLIELLVVIIILGILVAIAVPAYLSFAGNAKIAAAKSNVRSAIPAAESYYQDTVNNTQPGSYHLITGALLRTEAPGVSLNVKAVAFNGDLAYCIEDTEPTGVTWDYIGGNVGAVAITGTAATIEQGSCATEAGFAAT